MTGGWWGSHGGQLQRAQVTSTAARNINTKDVISDLLPSLKSVLDDRCAHLHRQRPPAAVARPHPPCSTPSTSTPAVHTRRPSAAHTTAAALLPLQHAPHHQCTSGVLSPSHERAAHCGVWSLQCSRPTLSSLTPALLAAHAFAPDADSCFYRVGASEAHFHS